jgi:hypothetical protein
VRIQRIRKRDGREVAYDRRKIEGAVARAVAAAGEPRPGFASEIADLVERLLERRFPDPGLAIPGIEDIQDLVERALVEMGAAAVAKAYILYRDKRTQIRAALLVREDRTDARRGARWPRVEVKDGVLAWSKGRIVAALMSEADLPRESAEAVAARVETRVFASGSKSISTALVRELVDNELVELGFEGALRRQRPIGVPRHDLRRALLDPASGSFARESAESGEGFGPGERVEEIVSGEILSRYAMEDLLPPYVAERVRSGDLDFEDLSRPHLPIALALPVEVLLAGEPGEAAASHLLLEIGGLARQVSRILSLEGAEPQIAVLGRASRAGNPHGGLHGSPLESWIAGLAAVAQASGRTIEIVLHGPRPAALEPLLEALTRLERERGPVSLPRVALEQPSWSKASAATRDAAGHLLRAGILVPCWSADGERYAGPGLSRRVGERGACSLGATATIDLPRIARRAGAWREDAVFEAVAELFEVALDGLSALRDFQRECREPSLPRAHATFAVSPVGLRESLAILGDGDLREEQAARLVAFLVEAGERLARARGLSLTLTPRFGERSATRFARLDAAVFPVRQPWLFDDPNGDGSVPESAYGVGFEISADAAFLAALGSVGTCALHPPSALRRLAGFSAAEPRDGGARLLEAWESLYRLRGRARGAAHALYALPPLLHASLHPASGGSDTGPRESVSDLLSRPLFASLVPELHADP